MTSALPPTGPPPAADPAGGWPPPPPPGPAPRPQLRRSRTDKVLGGVAGGLADYTGIDALLWRVGAIALTFAGGSGIIIYLLLWLLMAPAPPAQPGEATAVAQRSGPRSPVPGITVAALLLLAGMGVLIAQVTDWDLDAGRVFAIGLLVVGIGLAVAAVTGAGRASKGGLIALGGVLALAAAAASTVHIDTSRHAGIGDRTFRPVTAEQVQPRYDGGVGDLTVDLGGIDLAGRTTPVVTRIDAGIGDVDVLLPPDADVQVSVDSGIGDVHVFGEDNTNGYFAGNGKPWSGDGKPDVEITVHAGVGDVELSRG
jgi:phage shock protein PspC (stress-responsive transcriptional regulator)/predicted membrane protein